MLRIVTMLRIVLIKLFTILVILVTLVIGYWLFVMTVSKGTSQTIEVVKPEPSDHELLHTIFRHIPQIAKE